jgi:hypothetical protein
MGEKAKHRQTKKSQSPNPIYLFKIFTGLWDLTENHTETKRNCNKTKQKFIPALYNTSNNVFSCTENKRNELAKKGIISQ